MAQKNYAGHTIDVNDEGYFTDSTQWNREVAAAVAKDEGIELTDKHLAILEFLRSRHSSGDALSIRSINKSGIVDVKEFYALFPGAPLKKATKIAGIPKPSSCI
ncbi:MAG: TusE/DsrC/DsvC family sulfur relay protein [Bacteroidales bacterium]|jgi:tRNA 2-thiouridine synthesizing protein E|nr:TusE/DsrC/DsvC family sulfur relay protein [Bacteroidales bacterium]MDZ4058505.1 TusE/DsrC/DsvC family sulfur relay protein [Bacteroidales bacterium]